MVRSTDSGLVASTGVDDFSPSSPSDSAGILMLHNQIHQIHFTQWLETIIRLGSEMLDEQLGKL